LMPNRSTSKPQHTNGSTIPKLRPRTCY
jgi:hypothetical protein